MKEYFTFSMFKEQMRRMKTTAVVFIVGVTFSLIMYLIFLFLFDNKANPYLSLPAVWHIAIAPFIAAIFSEIVMKDLRTRNGCDFYHALPVARRNIMISGVLASICWMLIYMIVPVVIQSLLALILNIHAWAWGSFLDYCIYGVLISFYFLGASWLGHSLCGSRFSHIVITFMILCAPRMILYIFGYMLQDFMPYLLLNRFDFFFSPLKYNLFLRYLTELGPTTTSIVYTLILSSVYFGVAVWLIKRKPSERAGQPTWSSKMETVVRIIISAVVCIPAIIAVLRLIFLGTYASADERALYIMMIIGFYFLALFIYFLYEIIQTRKFKTAFKHWKGLGWVAAFNIAVIVMFLIVNTVVKNTTPDANDIASVTLIDLRKDTIHLFEEDEDAYVPGGRVYQVYTDLLYDIPFTSDVLKQEVTDELKKAVDDGIFYNPSQFNSRWGDDGIADSNKIRQDIVVTNTQDYQVSTFLDQNDLKEFFEYEKMNGENSRYETALRIELNSGKVIYRKLSLRKYALVSVLNDPDFIERVGNIDIDRVLSDFKASEVTIERAVREDVLFDHNLDRVLLEALISDVKEMTPQQKCDLMFHQTKYVQIYRQYTKTIINEDGYRENEPCYFRCKGYYDGWFEICIVSSDLKGKHELSLSVSPELTPNFYSQMTKIHSISINVKDLPIRDMISEFYQSINEGGDANVSN